MKVNISDLTWDLSVYPREGKSQKTVEAYVEALSVGAQFPPIKVQKVFNYPNGDKNIEATIILDGIHRWSAFREKGFKKIPVVEWKKRPLDYKKNRTKLLLEGLDATSPTGTASLRLTKKEYHEILQRPTRTSNGLKRLLPKNLVFHNKPSIDGFQIFEQGRRQDAIQLFFGCIN